MVISSVENRVLIVDDERLVRRVIRSRLTKLGFQCYEAESAIAALDSVRLNHPQLILLDVMMPGKTGIELLPEIKSSSPDSAVIMATAVVDVPTIIDCMRNGAHDYITKPFDLDEVEERVNSVLETKQTELQIKEYQCRLENIVGDQRQQINKLLMGSIESLVYALEAKDKYTAGHSRRVTNIAIDIGNKIGLSEQELNDLQCGALLHDVGKIAIDPNIQNKAGSLTAEEYRHMMTHAMIGVGIVEPVAGLPIVEIIAHHHDRYDGKGLNQTIQADDIPLGARIVALADSFDAMTSDRPYRDAMSVEQGLAEIKRCAGTQFDPTVVKAFLETVNDTPQL